MHTHLLLHQIFCATAFLNLFDKHLLFAFCYISPTHCLLTVLTRYICKQIFKMALYTAMLEKSQPYKTKYFLYYLCFFRQYVYIMILIFIYLNNLSVTNIIFTTTMQFVLHLSVKFQTKFKTTQISRFGKPGSKTPSKVLNF